MTQILEKKINIPRGIISSVTKETDFSETAVGIALGKYNAAANSVSAENTQIIIKEAVKIAEKRIVELQEFIDAVSHS